MKFGRIVPQVNVHASTNYDVTLKTAAMTSFCVVMGKAKDSKKSSHGLIGKTLVAVGTCVVRTAQDSKQTQQRNS